MSQPTRIWQIPALVRRNTYETPVERSIFGWQTGPRCLFENTFKATSDTLWWPNMTMKSTFGHLETNSLCKRICGMLKFHGMWDMHMTTMKLGITWPATAIGHSDSRVFYGAMTHLPRNDPSQSGPRVNFQDFRRKTRHCGTIDHHLPSGND